MDEYLKLCLFIVILDKVILYFYTCLFLQLEGLGQPLKRAKRQGEIHCIKVSRNAPSITHLLFVDDTIFLQSNIRRGSEILKTYEMITG